MCLSGRDGIFFTQLSLSVNFPPFQLLAIPHSQFSNSKTISQIKFPYRIEKLVKSQQEWPGGRTLCRSLVTCKGFFCPVVLLLLLCENGLLLPVQPAKFNFELDKNQFHRTCFFKLYFAKIKCRSVLVLCTMHSCQYPRINYLNVFPLGKDSTRFCPVYLCKTSIEPFSFGTWYPSLDGRSDDPA